MVIVQIEIKLKGMRILILTSFLFLLIVTFQTCNSDNEISNLVDNNKTLDTNNSDSDFQKCCNNMLDPWTDCIPGEIVGLKCQDGQDHGVTCECCRNTWLKYGPNPSYTVIPVRWLML